MMHVEFLALTPEQLAISPGVGAFVTVFVLAIAMVFLLFNMSKHLRRVDRHRIEAEMRAEFEAERAALEAAAGESPEGSGHVEDSAEGAPAADEAILAEDADAPIRDE